MTDITTDGTLRNSPDSDRVTKGERTRQRILQSALQMFAERGFARTSLRDVAAHAKITHAGLLHYFDGKDDLLATLMIERDENEMAAIQAYLAEQGDDGRPLHDADTVIIPWMVRDIARNQRQPEIAPLFVKLSAEATDPDHPANAHFRRRYRGLRKSLARAFAAQFAAADPPVTDRDPQRCAQQLIALADGLQVQWLLDPDSTDMVASLLDYLATIGVSVEGWVDLRVPGGDDA